MTKYFSNILIWNKDVGLIKISEGTGDNLLKEDIEYGYIDYIMVDLVEWDGNDELHSLDGSQVMLDAYYKDIFHNENDVVKYLIETEFIPDKQYEILSCSF